MDDAQRPDYEPAHGPGAPTAMDRRRFLLGLGSATAALAAGCGAPLEPEPDAELTQAQAIGPLGPLARAERAYALRVAAATRQLAQGVPPHPDNGDEERYPTRFASYSKSLPHDRNGDVLPQAYAALLTALRSGRMEDLEHIPLGGPLRLTDPQAAYAFELEGADPHALVIRPAPSFTSAEEQAEAAEVYWHSLLRDVPFEEYGSNPLAAAAAADLSRFSDFRGPKISGQVTPQTLFRGLSRRTLVGPYVSQFLLLDVPYGAQPFPQRNLTCVPGSDRMTTYEEWLRVQNGAVDFAPTIYDPVRRYARNGRDLAEWVHLDFPYQSALNAALIIAGLQPAELGMSSRTFDPANPYLRSRTQAGFATFGLPDVVDRLARVAVEALKAAWFQKWLVHRRLRPEEYGGRVHNALARGVPYPIGEELRRSPVLRLVAARQGTYLLSQVFPEGAPTHPAYPSGHATYVGASVTMLKAFFDESLLIPYPVVPSADGLTLLPYTGPPLTVGGELDKLAYNIAIARNFAGVHWRTDAEEGLRLGETVALRLMQDRRILYNEPFAGFTLTRFDGTTITV